MSFIKDESLICKNTIDGKRQEIVIKNIKDNGEITKLSDVLSQIPHGVFYKEETGIGATYLEFKTERNSIIVEPIKITASSKAREHKALYIGSSTAHFPNYLPTKEILQYCENTKIPFKKIVVVADSFPRLYKILQEKLFRDYFLMIDEIDSFQTDSSFRANMEKCLDLYLEFPKVNRALVSATNIDFTNPELQNENVTIIRYETPTKRNIDLFCSDGLRVTAIDKITEKIQQFPDDKIMIAYNSVVGCRALADKLVELNIATKNDIKILCSINSKQEVYDYYSDLVSDLLPAKINFFTSAYFSGFDLNEDFHLISLSSNISLVHALSEKRLKQIAGRCRKTLLSETIIYDLIPYYVPKNIVRQTAESIIAAAQKELESLKCIERNYAANDLLKKNLVTIRNLIIKYTEKDGHQYIRRRVFPKEENVISYFNIDAYLENVRVRDSLYIYDGSLYSILVKEGHNVNYLYKSEYEIFKDDNTVKKIRVEMVEKAIEIIKKNQPDELVKVLKGREYSPVQKGIVRAYLDNCNYINNEQLIKYLAEHGIMKDSRKLNSYLWAAFYESLDDSQHFKRLVRYHLPLNGAFTNVELMERWNHIFSESGMYQVIKSQVKAVRLTKIHFKTLKRKKTVKFILRSENPNKIKVIQKRIAFRNEKDFENHYKRLVSK